MLQLTFDGNTAQPAQYTPFQEVTTEDGQTVLFRDAFPDLNGNLWSTAELCQAADDDIQEAIEEEQTETVEKFIEKCEEWISEYCRGDYFDGLDYLMSDSAHEIKNTVREWLKENNYNSFSDSTIDDIVSDAIEQAELETTGEYDPTPFDLGIYSFPVGEYKEQIEIDEHLELADIPTEILKNHFHTINQHHCWKCNGKGIDRTAQAFQALGIDVEQSKFWDATCCHCNGSGRGSRYGYLYYDPCVTGHWGLSDESMQDIVNNYQDDIELTEETLAGVVVTLQDAKDAGCCNDGIIDFATITGHLKTRKASRADILESLRECTIPATALLRIAENTNIVDDYYDQIIDTLRAAYNRHRR